MSLSQNREPPTFIYKSRTFNFTVAPRETHMPIADKAHGGNKDAKEEEFIKKLLKNKSLSWRKEQIVGEGGTKRVCLPASI